MKIVGLLRHAKSSRDDPHLRDFDRPLTRRGVRASELMGTELRRCDVTFDLVLASTARRVVETIENFEKGYGEPLKLQFEPALYENSARTLLNILDALDDTSDRVLFVGHNPSLQSLAMTLAASEDIGYSEVASAFPTAAFVLIELPIRHWSDVKPGTGRIARFLKPRDLDRRTES
ncbi:MAG: histidine phosphatase family protein [Sphingomicrobium sp.]